MARSAWTANSPSMSQRFMQSEESEHYEQGSDQTVNADAEGRAVVRMPAQAAAGYEWRVADVGPDVLMEHRKVEPGSTFGAAAVETFHLRLLRQAEATLTLELKRPWESKSARRCRITIRPAGA